MRTSRNLGINIPEGPDDVLVDVLGEAIEAIDEANVIHAGSGTAVDVSADGREQTVRAVPFQSVNAESADEFPSSSAVAAFVAAQVSGSGTYQGQYDYYGSLAQIRAVADAGEGVDGLYLEGGTVYVIAFSGGAWPASGTVAASQVSGDSYDVRNLLDYPATGGGYETGQVRLVRADGDAEFVVTGASKAVRSVTAKGEGVSVDNSDPFNPKVGAVFGTVSAANDGKPVSGKAVADEVAKKQNLLAGTENTAVLFGSSAGAVRSRAITTTVAEGSGALVTSGGVADAMLTLEGEAWIVSFASERPAALPNEKILWLHE